MPPALRAVAQEKRASAPEGSSVDLRTLCMLTDSEQAQLQEAETDEQRRKRLSVLDAEFERRPYTGRFTHDILPDSDTGSYFVEG